MRVKGVLRKIIIPYVNDIEQQKKIVKEVETRLYMCKDIEKVIKETLLRTEAMRQSILKEAFEGRL